MRGALVVRRCRGCRWAVDLRFATWIVQPRRVRRNVRRRELVRRIVEGEHPVRAWRTHRGMTARSLAVAAGIPSSYLSAIERGVKPGSVKALKGLATALDVPLDDLV